MLLNNLISTYIYVYFNCSYYVSAYNKSYFLTACNIQAFPKKAPVSLKNIPNYDDRDGKINGEN